MKKIFIMILTMCSLLLVACGTSPYEDYVAATEKTATIEKLGYQVEIMSQADIDTEGLSTKAKRNYNFFKNLRVEIQGKKDSTSGQIEQVIRYNLNGIGFDIVYYQNKASKWLKVPFLDKYILIENEDMLVDEEAYLMPAQETIDGWEALWMDTVESDKVFREEKDLVETPAGEVKATKYIVEIQGQALKTFAKKSIDLLLADVAFVDGIEEEVNSQLDEGETFNFRTVLQDVQLQINDIGLEDLVFESYVSIDQYIIKEVFKTNISFEAFDHRMKQMTIRYEGIIFDINQDQDINIPEIGDEQVTTMEEFQDGFPIKIDGFKE